MRKDSRLSFRISPRLSSRIDLAVKKSRGDIRDRSEFGTKSVECFLRHVLGGDTDLDLIGKILLTIADKLEVSGKEIQEVKDFVYFDDLTPVEIHPKFEDIMIMRERLPREIKKELSKRLFTAKYGELDRLYADYYFKYQQIFGISEVRIEHKVHKPKPKTKPDIKVIQRFLQ